MLYAFMYTVFNFCGYSHKFEFYLEEKVVTMNQIIKKDLPTLFFTPKYQAIGGPCLQLLEYHGTALSVDCFISETVDISSSRHFPSDTLFQSTDNDPKNFWYLPYQIAGIPILDFQYVSWLPSPYKPIHIYQESVFEIFSNLRRVNLHKLESARLSVTTPPRPPSSETFTPPPLPTRPPAATATEPPKPIRVKDSSLPTHVIDALIRDAKSGKESCPISMNTYNECEELSITSCFHIFDRASIDHWLKHNTTCPVCRKESTVIA